MVKTVNDVMLQGKRIIMREHYDSLPFDLFNLRPIYMP